MCYFCFAREVFSTVDIKYRTRIFVIYNVFLIKRFGRIGAQRVLVGKPKEMRQFGRES
jgi:hypothetical protein